MSNHKVTVFLSLSFALTLSLLPHALAAATVFTQATALLTQVMNFFQGIATAGLVIGVGWGMFMRQTAGGDHQQVLKANGIMKGAFVAWAVFSGINLITNTLLPYLS